MKEKNPPPITSITLEGFQVFDKPTEIPLDRLTFLFGPNSAGKSAVRDALDLYHAICKSDREVFPGISDLELCALLKRHWRRTNESDESTTEALCFAIAHTCESETLLYDICEQLKRQELGVLNLPSSYLMVSHWMFYKFRDDDPIGPGNIFAGATIWVNDELLFEYMNDAIFKINLEHALFTNIEKRVNYSDVINANPDSLELENGILSVNGVAPCFGAFNPNNRWTIQNQHTGVVFDRTARNNDYCRMLDDITDILHGITSSLHGGSIAPTIVEASRTIPPRRDLTFIDLCVDDQHLMSELANEQHPILTQHKNSRYKEFEESLVSTVRYSEKQSQELGPSPEKYAESINHALSHHLFLEQGYRFDFDYRILLSKLNSIEAANKEDLYDEEFTYFYELFLRDGQGRKHFIEDVGSGIGYILPVLCAVYATRSRTCFIQQPELHIHPALQSALGDVLIEASKTGPQQLIETHSEHLLLRILKRIRQTHGQVSIADELKITADDVCVLYFDPSPDGTTTVKRLRITEDGEFMDRWPRGFFTERDQDLLDE